MSKVISQDPILLIENLLDAGIGDNERLLYLRNYVKKGKPIYDSDRKFLERMQIKLYELNPENYDKPSKSLPFEEESFDSYLPLESKFDKLNYDENFTNKKNTHASAKDTGIVKIQKMIDDLKNSEFKLKENFEFFLGNKKNFNQITTVSLNSSSVDFKNIQKNSFQITTVPLISNSAISKNIQNDSSQLTSLLEEKPKLAESKFLRFTKYDAMAYASAGLFTLWYASFQNMIDLGPIQNLTLGLSAGAATMSFIFYKQKKKL